MWWILQKKKTPKESIKSYRWVLDVKFWNDNKITFLTKQQEIKYLWVWLDVCDSDSKQEKFIASTFWKKRYLTPCHSKASIVTCSDFQTEWREDVCVAIVGIKMWSLSW
jgi:hypothetical protein